MNTALRILICCGGLGISVCSGQGQGPVPSAAGTSRPVSAATAMSPGGAAGSAVPRLKLKGLFDVPPVRVALLEVETTGRWNQHMLRVGDRRDELELVGMDVRAGTATLRYHGKVLELKFTADDPQGAAELQSEREKDISHTTHHARRAQLEREIDEQQRRDIERGATEPAH